MRKQTDPLSAYRQFKDVQMNLAQVYANADFGEGSYSDKFDVF